MGSATPAPRGATRSRIGQGWALAACLVLTLFATISSVVYVILTQVLLVSRIELVLAVIVAAATMAWPVTLLALSAAVLRRAGLSIIAVVVGLVHLLGLLGLVLLHLADLSVSISVASVRPLGVLVVAVALTTAGAGLALRRRGERWPATATLGVGLATVGTVLSIVAEAVAGPLLPTSAPSSVSLLPFLEPAAIVLVGLAVARRHWPLAAVAAGALLIALVSFASGLVPQLWLILADDYGQVHVLSAILTLVRTLLALAAVIGLTVTLVRTPAGADV